MTFETEMNQFFARNCYSEKERDKVQASPAYRRAMEINDGPYNVADAPSVNIFSKPAGITRDRFAPTGWLTEIVSIVLIRWLNFLDVPTLSKTLQ